MGDNDINVETAEQEAREVGWKPLEEFKGDPDKWVDAEEYLKRGETMLPILRGNLRDLRKELKTRDAKHQAELAELKGTLGEVREYYSKAEQRAYDKALKDVRAEMKQAVAEGDTEKYNALEGQLDELVANPGAKPEAKPQTAPKPLPGWEHPEKIIAEWRKDNEWYWSDPFLGMEGQQLSGYLASTKTYATMRDMLDEVTELMKKRHPEAFGQRRKGSDDVDGGGERGGSSAPRKGKHTLADLPPDDRKLFERFKRDIPNYTWEEFEAAYEWEK